MKNKTKAIILMVLSTFFFAIMSLIIGMTSDTVPLFTQLFFRNLVATFITFVAVKKNNYQFFGKKENRKLLLGRVGFGYMGMITTFYASGNGEQGDVATILKMAPFVVSILAFFFLKEKISKFQIIALIVATLGAVIVANPEFNTNIFPLIVAMFAATFAGTAYAFVSALKGKEPPEVIIFVFSFFSTVATIPLMIPDFVMPSLSDFILLTLIGITAALGQATLTYSYTFAKASEVSIYQYSGIIFSMILGFAFLGQNIKVNSLIGSALVILAGVIVYKSNKDKV